MLLKSLKNSKQAKPHRKKIILIMVSGLYGRHKGIRRLYRATFNPHYNSFTESNSDYMIEFVLLMDKCKKSETLVKKII